MHESVISRKSPVPRDPIFRSILISLGFAQPDGNTEEGSHGHAPHDAGGHGHTHGVIDPTIATTTRGIWAIKWSFIILALTAAFQLTIVFWSGSVALLADTIHSIGDSVTAVPLWSAFRLARRKPSSTFTYGYGRVEDLAGVLIVLIILFSAIVAGYEATNRLIQGISRVLSGYKRDSGARFPRSETESRASSPQTRDAPNPHYRRWRNIL